MDTNPYSPPKSIVDAQPKTTPIGPTAYRDGPLLVVRRHGNEFAPICVGSGAPADDWHTIKTKQLSTTASMASGLLGGLLGGLIAMSLFGTLITVTLPVNRSWLKSALRGSMTSRLVVGLGCVAMLGSVVLAVSNGIFMLFGLILFVASLAYALYAQKSSNQLRIVNSSDDWIWIDGACQSVIDGLPPFESKA